jgi:hypothetical protein
MSGWGIRLLRKSISLPHLWEEGLSQKMQKNGAAEFGAHARIRTGDLFLTKEVLEDHFPIGAPLRSNAESFANNRCLAALPRKCHIFASVNPVDAQTCFARLSVRWPVATRFASTYARRYQPLSSAPPHPASGAPARRQA